MTTRGIINFLHKPKVKFSGGHPQNVYYYFLFYTIVSKYWFQTKPFAGLLEFIKLYKQNPLESFYFHCLPKYTLALTVIVKKKKKN